MCALEEFHGIVMTEKDDVATALVDLEAGSLARARLCMKVVDTRIRNPVPFGHKYAIRNIRRGEKVIKYGEVIGEALDDIGVGELVHVHNIVSQRGRGDKRDKTR
jgi:altronate dehydratase small subunit